MADFFLELSLAFLAIGLVIVAAALLRRRARKARKNAENQHA